VGSNEILKFLDSYVIFVRHTVHFTRGSLDLAHPPLTIQIQVNHTNCTGLPGLFSYLWVLRVDPNVQTPYEKGGKDPDERTVGENPDRRSTPKTTWKVVLRPFGKGPLPQGHGTAPSVPILRKNQGEREKGQRCTWIQTTRGRKKLGCRL